MKIQKFCKKYHNNIIFDNVNLKVDNNQIVFLMGANGSGKTTLLKCILGLEKFSGQINLHTTENIKHVAGEVSVVYDQMPLYLNLTGYQNIKLLATKQLHDNDIEDFSDLLDKKTLKKKVKHYSFGQRKLLSIIISLLHQPKFIFLDEVSNGLDYEMIKRIKRILSVYAENSLVFLTGHNFEFYEDITHTVLVIKDRNIVVYDTSYKSNENRTELADIYEEIILHDQKRD